MGIHKNTCAVYAVTFNINYYVSTIECLHIHVRLWKYEYRFAIKFKLSAE